MAGVVTHLIRMTIILYVKASGTELAKIDANGFVKLDRSKLDEITIKVYPSDEAITRQAANRGFIKMLH